MRSHLIAVLTALVLTGCIPFAGRPPATAVPVVRVTVNPTVSTGGLACPINTPEQAGETAQTLMYGGNFFRQVGEQRVTGARRTSMGELRAMISSGVSPNEPDDAAIWIITLAGSWQVAPPNSPAAYESRYTLISVAFLADSDCETQVFFASNTGGDSPPVR